MNAWYDYAFAWFADYYLLATIMLAVVLASSHIVRQPARRIAIAWSTAGGLLLMAVLVALPGWSVVHLFGAAPPRPELLAPVPIESAPDLLENPRSDFELLPTYQDKLDAEQTATVISTRAAVPAMEITQFNWNPYLLAPLASGCFAMFAWLVVGVWQTNRMLRRAAPAPVELERLLGQLDPATKSQLRLSSLVGTGVALGLRRPTILLPQTYADSYDHHALRSVLAHELAHLKHGDLWLLAILRILMVPLWAHPLYWLARRRVRLDQEMMADAAAAELAGRSTYAEQLVGWARELNSSPPTLAGAVGLWETKSQLRRRIAVLLDEKLTILRNCSRRWKLSAVAFCATAAVGLSLLTVQPASLAEENTDAKTESQAAFDEALAAEPAEPEQVDQGGIPSSIRVRVQGASGQALPGARVFWNIGAEGPPEGTGNLVTDTNGEVTLPLPPSLRLLRLWAGAEGHASEFVQLYFKSQNEQENYTKPLPEVFTFDLEAGTTMGGQVVNEAGEPIAGATVDARVNTNEEMNGVPRPSLWWNVDGTAETDEDGRWSLNRVPGGSEVKFSLKLKHPNYVDDSNWGRMQREQGVTLAQLREGSAKITMSRGIQLTGTVTNGAGEAIEGALVIWGDDPYFQPGSQEVLTDAEGKYRLPPLARGKMSLTVIAEGWAPELRKVDVGSDADIDFELQSGTPLRIRFVDSDGKAIPNASVYIDSWQGSQSLHNQLHSNVIDTKIPRGAGQDGVYEWSWAPTIPVALHLGAKGFHLLRSKQFRAVAGREYVVQLQREDEPQEDLPTIDEIAEEHITTLGDEVTRQPQTDVQAAPPRSEFNLVIAKNMMLLDGREFITWPELEDRIAKQKDASKTRLHYYVTDAAREAGLEELQAAKHKLLAEKFGIVGYSIGSLWPRSSVRYDALETPDELTPNPDHAVAVEISTADGQPVGGAEVLLIEPVPDSISYRTYSMAMVDGRVRNQCEHVLSVTDVNGKATVYPSTDSVKYYLMVLHPQHGFALVKREGRASAKPITLASWGTVAGKILSQDGFQQTANFSTRVNAVDGWPEIGISQYTEDQEKELPDGEFAFASVPPNLPSVLQRNLKNPGGSSRSLPTRELQLEPGGKQIIEIGDFSSTERLHLEINEQLRRRREQETNAGSQ